MQTSNEQDDEELSNEFRMLKKLKKGKITEEEFELAVGEKDTEDILQLQTKEPKDTEKNMEPTTKIENNEQKNLSKDRNDSQKNKKRRRRKKAKK